MRNRKEEIGIFWLIHFGQISPGDAKCFECTDFKAGVCEGGQDPIKCMLQGSQDGQSEVFGFGLISKKGIKAVGEMVLECAKLKKSSN